MPSITISRHHIFVARARPKVLQFIRSILKPWSHDARPPAIPRINPPIVSGQGLNLTIWKGCRGGRGRAQDFLTDVNI